MAYYTQFNLTYSYVKPSLDTEDDDILRRKICKTLAEISLYLEVEDVDDMLSYFVEHSWYDHEDDMKALARKFPEIRFSLEGIGEEQGDMWIKDFWGDKFCERRAKIIKPEDQPLVWK